MKVVALSKNRQLILPNKCAVCCAEAIGYSNASNVEATGFYGIAYTQSRIAVRYPVCKKHKMSSLVYSWISGQGAVQGFLLISLISVFLSVGLVVSLNKLLGMDNLITKDYGGHIIFSAIVFVIGCAVYLTYSNPVRLIRNSDERLGIRFKNIEYAQEFERKNG